MTGPSRNFAVFGPNFALRLYYAFGLGYLPQLEKLIRTGRLLLEIINGVFLAHEAADQLVPRLVEASPEGLKLLHNLSESLEALLLAHALDDDVLLNVIVERFR